MKSVRLLIFFILLLNCNKSFSQDTTWNWMAPIRFVPSIAYVYQKIHNVELTVGVVGIQKNHRYLLLRAGVDIFKRNVWYLAPLSTIVYYHGLGKFAAVGNLHFWGKKINGNKNFFITPEVGIAYGPVHISYGYNFPLSATTSSLFGNHRATLRLGF